MNRRQNVHPPIRLLYTVNYGKIIQRHFEIKIYFEPFSIRINAEFNTFSASTMPCAALNYLNVLCDLYGITFFHYGLSKDPLHLLWTERTRIVHCIQPGIYNCFVIVYIKMVDSSVFSLYLFRLLNTYLLILNLINGVYVVRFN